MTDSYDEDDAPRRPRWIGWAIVIFMALIAFGVLNVGWLIMRPTPAADAMKSMLEARPELAAGKALIEGSDCMRCHGMQRHFVGPSFEAISARYAGEADAVEHLARRIREGSVGVWGNVIMPRHPQITPEQSQQMAAWVMAVPPAAPEAAASQVRP
ncbi:MAG: c-type cytochrome [Burkholderiaceae bacterium]|nr:c-type cytochrome [Burkholderiaceae bacterium]